MSACARRTLAAVIGPKCCASVDVITPSSTRPETRSKSLCCSIISGVPYKERVNMNSQWSETLFDLSLMTSSGALGSSMIATLPSGATTRGLTFVLTQQIIGAEEARSRGVISEIVRRESLLNRAHEIAQRLAALPPLTASYTRVALTQKLRRLVDESFGDGLALEGISAADVARSQANEMRSG